MSFTAVFSPVHPQAVRATRPLILIAVQVSSTNSTVDDDDDEICWQRDRLAVAKFSKSGVWNKVLEGSGPNLIFEDAHISL